MSPARENTGGRCQLCGRDVPRRQRHHLIPKTRHSNRRNKRDFEREEVRERTAMLCRPCHKTLHATLDEKQLEREYNTLEALGAQPEIARFLKWVRKQPPGASVTVRRSADLRGRRRRAARKPKRR
jgi:hypothetical protein